MKNNFRSNLKTSSEVLVYIVAVLTVLSVWINNIILAIAVITISLLAIVLDAISFDKGNLINVFKDINTYFFFDFVLIAVSRLIDNDILFYVCIAIFVIILVLYILFNFIINSKDNKRKANGKK